MADSHAGGFLSPAAGQRRDGSVFSGSAKAILAPCYAPICLCAFWAAASQRDSPQLKLAEIFGSSLDSDEAELASSAAAPAFSKW